MKIVIYIFYLLLTASLNTANATSTAFDQKTILKLSDEGKSLNESFSSSANLSSILIAGTINYFGIKVYKTGYLHPLGLIPPNISNLSPLAYLERENNIKGIKLSYNCYSDLNKSYVKKNIIISNNYFNGKICKKIIKQNKLHEINNLVGRYY